MVEEAQSDDQDELNEAQLPQSPLIQKGYLVSGKYELEYKIGQGGMGTVWAARHTKLGQRAAVKFISTAHIESEDALRRFDSEAKAAATIRSRNVVQVFDNGELEDGTPYMVMEYLEGESLHSRIERDGSLSVEEALRIARHVGKALSVAHGMSIIHRDIKPENVFLATAPDESEYTAKVLDFGVAKFLQARGQAHARTRTGTIVGTPLYMSPEQVRGLKSIDHRTDIYSLGALTFTMLTGTLVFDGKTFGDLLFQICTEPLPKLTDAAPWLPPGVNDWFERACARSADDRYQTVGELVEGLADAVGMSIRATMPDTEGLASSSPDLSPLPKTDSVSGSPRRAVSISGVEERARVSGVADTMMATMDEPSAIRSTPKAASAPNEAPSSVAHPAPAAGSNKLLMVVVIGFGLLIVIAAAAFYLGGRMAAQEAPAPAPTQHAP
jgi:eukaryotic-like serine/threonine-protein kinase